MIEITDLIEKRCIRCPAARFEVEVEEGAIYADCLMSNYEKGTAKPAYISRNVFVRCANEALCKQIQGYLSSKPEDEEQE